MFKKLKDKITEEVKISPQRFQQLTQSVSDKLQGSTTTTTTTTVAATDESFFSIADDDTNMSDLNMSNQGFSSVKLMSPGSDDSRQKRRDSITSLSSDISFLPKYESGSLYHLQSDLDVSASEYEDNVSQSSSSGFGRLSKEQLYSAFKKTQMQYHKYRGRYTDLARHYKEMEREITKMKSVLVETQDKAFRRITELKEQCALEQKAKAHLEAALRDDLDEKQLKIESLQTKVNLLQQQGQQLAAHEMSNNHVISDTNIKMENLTTYLNDARNEIEMLNIKIQEFKANSIVSQSREQEYKMKISNLEKEIEKFSEREKDNTIKLAESKMELHNELLNKDTEINHLKKDLETLRNTIQDNEEKYMKIDNLQNQNHKLIDKVEFLKQKCNTMETDLLRINQYELKIKSLNEELVSLRDRVNEGDIFKNKTEILQKENQELVEVANNTKSELVTMHDECHMLNLENDQLKAVIESNKKQYELLKQELITVEQKLTKENTEKLEILQNNYTELLKEKDSQKKQIASLEQQLEAASKHNTDIQKLQLIIDDLTQEVKNYEKLCMEKEHSNVQLAQEILQLETTNTEILEKLRLIEEQEETVTLETTESDLLQLKLQKLEEEKQNLLDEFEDERKVFNDLLKENKELKIKDIKIEELESRNKHLEDKVSRFKSYLKNKDEDIVDLQKTKLELEQQVEKLQEQVRIETEHEETLEMGKTEENLLLLKIQQLETEKASLIESFETEREMFNQSTNQVPPAVDNNKDDILNENVLLAKENLELKRINDELTKKVSIFEEREQVVELESTECNLMKLKVQKLENEKEELLKTVEMEREMFNKALIDHKEFLSKEEEIKGLTFSNQKLTEKLAEFKTYLKKKDEEIVELQKIKLELEKQALNLNENLRIKEEENDSLVIEQTECDLLQMKVKTLEEEKESLESSFNVERQLFERSISETEQIKDKLEQLRKQNEILLDENRELSEMIRKQIEEAESANKVIRAERDAALKETEYVRVELWNALERNEKKYDELQTEFDKNHKYVEQLENEKKEKWVELERCKHDAIELKTSFIEIEQVKSEMNELKEKLNHLQNDKMKKLENDAELQKKIVELDEKLHQYKSLDITNKSSLEFYENEMEKLRNKNEKLNQRLDETLVTLNHCTDISESTEIEYLRNILYKYMLGQESVVLARVIAAVLKFDEHQTETILQKEQQKQTLLGQLGIL